VLDSYFLSCMPSDLHIYGIVNSMQAYCNTELCRIHINSLLSRCRQTNKGGQVYSRRQQFHLRWRYPANSIKYSVVLDSGPLAPLCENMMSSTESEVHNVLHCRQRMTKPRPQITRTLCGIWTRVFLRYAIWWTDRQKDIQTRWTQYYAPLPEAK